MGGVMEVLFGTEVIRWTQSFFGVGHPLPFRILSLLGDTWGMIFVAGLSLWLFGRERLYAVVGIIVVGAVTKEIFSNIFHQTRPRGPGIVVYDQLEISSFPSGHVYEAVGPWGLLYAAGCVPLGIAVAVTVGVSLGRLYLGAHYLGDVLGGIVLAIPLVWIFARAWPSARAWLRRGSRAFALGVVAMLLVFAAGWLVFVGGTPRRYEILGMVVGGSAALLHLSARPSPPLPVASWRARSVRVLVGLVGIVALLLLDRTAPEDARLLGTVTAGLATLWALLVAPALFSRMSLANTASDSAPHRRG